MTFLNKIITELRQKSEDLSIFNIILPGKRPIVFIKKILEENHYSGMLPNFFTIEDLIQNISGKQAVDGIALWLYSFDVYREQQPHEDFANFLKWFPTMLKDWDDMLKFSTSDTAVLEAMFTEERLKNWAENLGEDDRPYKRFLDFWQKMNHFLPILKRKLSEKNWATNGMIHESAKNKIDEFAKNTTEQFVFCGFNALTPVEKKLVRQLLQWDKALCFFQTDQYYIKDERQEAGKFLREIKQWKEFNESREFKWIENDFAQDKNIKVYEVPGNITQTKVLPEIFANNPDKNLSNTAVVLLDENLLPACLDAMSGVEYLNITMGFPLKNLGFSNGIKHLFYLQKQLEKKDSSYYYHDILTILEELPSSTDDWEIIRQFKAEIEKRNMVYISKKQLKEFLATLSYLNLLEKPQNPKSFIDAMIAYCQELKFQDLDNILYENISHFEKSFKIIKNQLAPYSFDIKMEILESLINQLVNTESIDFQGEPLQGVQVMGLLETRLLNFENIILLSVNEGKLPLGNSQNTYLPFDIRQQFNMHTFLENDSIYAYHFYRLIQDSTNVHLLFNSLTSGVNTGEKSRFITQIELEDSHHKIENIIIENESEPIGKHVMSVEKTPAVLAKLEEWKKRISASHLISFIYNPIDFYLTKILGTHETVEIEEELSQRSYGNLVHHALQLIYEKTIGKPLTINDLEYSDQALDEVINQAILKMNHQPEFYNNGMNYIHREVAERVIRDVLNYDKNLIASGNTLEILNIESKFENVNFFLNSERSDQLAFYGFIDRVDRLNGQLRIIDYKTAKPKNLKITKAKSDEDSLFFKDDNKQAMQLCIYAYSVLESHWYKDQVLQCGIWSFAEAKHGVQNLEIFSNIELSAAVLAQPMKWVGAVIEEILNPELDFVEIEKVEW